MDDQNQQITEQSFLFSFIHSNTKYDFISLSKITHFQHSSVYICQIYPLNLNKEIIRVNNNQLKIEINRLLLQSNLHILSTGFKFKLHPVKGIFSLQYSYLCFSQTNLSFSIGQKNHSLQNNIIQKLIKSTLIKDCFLKILNFIEEGSTLQNKSKNFNQLLKFSYNSQFYAWISPNKEKINNIKIFKEAQASHKNSKKLEIWSDCSQDEDQFCTEKEIQTNQSLNDKISPMQKSKKDLLSEFYVHHRSVYDKITPFAQNEIKSNQNLQGYSDLNNDLVIKYFISQNEDHQLYQKHIEKHIQKARQQELKRSNKSKQQMKQNTIDINLNQTQWQSNLVSFIESNQRTLSKSSKWKIIITILSKLYQDFIMSKVKQKSQYLDMRMYKIQKNLNLNLKSKTDQMGCFIVPKIKKVSNEENQSQSETQLLQDFFKNQEKQQKNIASIMLHMTCLICLPEIKFMKRRFTKAQQQSHTKYYMMSSKHRKIQRSMQGEFYKFKSTNLQLESILFYLYQKVLKFKQVPFGDWVIIMCQNINEIFQNNTVLSF